MWVKLVFACSDNVIGIAENMDLLQPALGHIQMLFINRCHITWPQVGYLISRTHSYSFTMPWLHGHYFSSNMPWLQFYCLINTVLICHDYSSTVTSFKFYYINGNSSTSHRLSSTMPWLQFYCPIITIIICHGYSFTVTLFKFYYTMPYHYSSNMPWSQFYCSVV